MLQLLILLALGALRLVLLADGGVLVPGGAPRAERPLLLPDGRSCAAVPAAVCERRQPSGLVLALHLA